MANGPELVVPNCFFDGPAHIVYAFTGENDDGGVTYEPFEPLPPGNYAYSFECLSIQGDTPMHVSICGELDFEGGHVRGATEPGLFTGEITVCEHAAAQSPQHILLSVTGTPTVATARNLSVYQIID